jgi:hypothetical protein
VGFAKLSRLMFQLHVSSNECLYEISENAFQKQFSVIILIPFSHDANLLQEGLAVGKH